MPFAISPHSGLPTKELSTNESADEGTPARPPEFDRPADGRTGAGMPVEVKPRPAGPAPDPEPAPRERTVGVPELYAHLPPLLSTDQMTALLACSYKTLRRLVITGVMPEPIKWSDRFLQWPLDEVVLAIRRQAQRRSRAAAFLDASEAAEEARVDAEIRRLRLARATADGFAPPTPE